jgi:hypothetical protein
MGLVRVAHVAMMVVLIVLRTVLSRGTVFALHGVLLASSSVGLDTGGHGAALR